MEIKTVFQLSLLLTPEYNLLYNFFDMDELSVAQQSAKDWILPKQ